MQAKIFRSSALFGPQINKKLMHKKQPQQEHKEHKAKIFHPRAEEPYICFRSI